MNEASEIKTTWRTKLHWLFNRNFLQDYEDRHKVEENLYKQYGDFKIHRAFINTKWSLSERLGIFFFGKTKIDVKLYELDGTCNYSTAIGTVDTLEN